MSEPETLNVAETLQIERIDYFLDVHLYARKILLPWALEDWQGANSTQWFGNKAWDRRTLASGLVTGGREGPGYTEWFPQGLWNEHLDLAKAMQNQIDLAADPNVAESAYDITEAGAGLYRSTGTGHDYDASLQFLPDNREGTEKFALTFEAGSDLDGGFFPDLTTGQYQKVERDIHGGVVGFLLQIVAWAASGPLYPPRSHKH